MHDLVNLASKSGYVFTTDELNKFIKSHNKLSLKELEEVSGGKSKQTSALAASIMMFFSSIPASASENFDSSILQGTSATQDDTTILQYLCGLISNNNIDRLEETLIQ